MSDDSRATLERLCAERGESLAGLSRLLGRNDAYIQQFLRKGTPRRLPERERRVLARYFSIPDSMLGGPEADPALETGELVPVARGAVRASAGPGAVASDAVAKPHFAFQNGDTRRILHPKIKTCTADANRGVGGLNVVGFFGAFASNETERATQCLYREILR